MILYIIRIVFSLAFLTAICLSDRKSSKIRNKAVVTFSVVGIILSLFDGGIVSSLVGMLFPLVLLPLFAFGMLGAGDIKAFCGLGAIWGIRMSARIIAFSFLAGGVMALAIMLTRGNFISRIRHIFTYLKLCVIAKRPLPYDEKRDGRFKFAYSIAAGTVVALIIGALQSGVSV